MALQRSMLRCISKSQVLTPSRQLSVSAVRKNEERPPTAQMDNLMEIGSRPIFSSEQDLFRKSARRFFQEEVAPNIPEWEKRGYVSREVWEKAGENGFLGVAIPAEHGGMGGTYTDAAIIMEESAYVNGSAPGYGLHSDIALPYFTRYGTMDQIQKYVPDCVAGKKILAIAMSEPGAGSDLQGIRTTAKRKGDDWVINGSKIFITNGYLADIVIVVALTDPTAKSPAHGISLFIVEDDMKGFSKGRLLKKMGTHAQDTAELFFEDVVVPKENLLGKENGGFYHLMQDLPQERLNIAVGTCALSEFLFEETRKYVKDRKVFGKQLSSKQTVQHKLAEMKTEICVARAFTDQCIKLHTDGKLDNDMASMSKYYMSDLVNKVAYQAVQLHGGMGYMWETQVARAYVNARVTPIFGGSNEIMKELIARKIVQG